MPVTLELKELRARLHDAEETLRAIQSGEVDAVVISAGDGEQVYTLRGADFQYRVLIEEMNEGAVIMDGQGTITYCNKRFAEMLKAPLEKVIGSSFSLFVPRARQESFFRLLEYSKTGNTRSEFMLVATGGSQVPVYLAFSAPQASGLSGTYMVATDLTEQKRNDEIVADEQLARLILDQVAEAVIVCDVDGQVIRASQAAQHLAGQEARWQHFDDLFPLTLVAGVGEQIHFADSGDGAEEHVNLSLTSIAMRQELRNSEVSFSRSAGSAFTLLLNVSPLLDPALTVIGYVITLTDITERKQGEKLLQTANVELEQRAQALTGSNAELQKFAYVASHDLQEPLRTITSYSQLIHKRYGGKLDEKADRYLNFVADAAIRMQQLIEDLLNYSRVSTEERPLQRTDCAQILAQVLANLDAAIAQSKANVTWEPMPTLNAEPSQLMELFQNLISNAIKFQGVEPQRVHISAKLQGAEWVFCVRDNGIGIDQQYSERIFVIFQRLHTREQYRGTGIGLAICKRIIERHNGRIWLESQPGEGAAFFFTLPATI